MTELGAQLELGTNPHGEVCACGHDEHIGPCQYGLGTKFGACQCQRFTPRGFVPIELPKGLQPPAGALDLIRPELKRRKGKSFEQRKSFGWVLVGPSTLLAYLSQLETVSPNVYKQTAKALNFGRITAAQHKQRMAILGQGEARQRERAMLAVETAHVEDRARPTRAILTRIVSGPGLDKDNLEGALKHVRDGVAEGLLETSDKLFDNGACDLTYAQSTPGKRGIFGVRIELSWGAS